MIRIEKEVCINDTWIHIDTAIIKDSDADTSTIWQMMHLLGDTHKRRYSNITKMAVDFIAPDCHPHHLNHKALVMLREKMGAFYFDKYFGFFPFDPIDAFADSETRNHIVASLGITGARVIAWKE